MSSPPRRRDRDDGSSRKDSEPRHRRSAYDSDHERSRGYRRGDSRERRRHSRDRYRDRRDEDRSERRTTDRRRERSRSTSPTRSRRRAGSSSPRSRDEKSSRRDLDVANGGRSKRPLPSQDDSFNHQRQVEHGEPPPVAKQKPNYKPTGLLAKEANTVAGTTTVLKYHEPPEARKPSSKEQWRLFVFKKKDLLDTIHLYRKSVWLVGRDSSVTDLLLEHPSISKQHAVLQFRYITSTNEFGDRISKVKPYLIDLDSANGTSLNGKKIEASRFIEVVDGDVISFGDSEREYVAMLPSQS